MWLKRPFFAGVLLKGNYIEITELRITAFL
jgi:hypothetical protein